MTPETVVRIAQEMLWITSLLAAPLLLTALASGLLIGILQAATSVQEITVSFVPQLIAMAVALFVGSKERVVMLEVNGERLLLGVAPGSVTAIGRVNGDQIDLTNQPEPAVPGAEAS